MTDVGVRVFRIVQRAYPKELRREHGAEMEQLFRDRQRHGGVPAWRVLARELTDAATVAPILRLENHMTRIIAISIGITLTLCAAILAGGGFAVPLAVLLIAALLLTRGRMRLERPVDGARRGLPLLVCGLAAIAVGVLIPAMQGGRELNAWWWSLMAVAFIGGIGLAIAGALMLVTLRRPHPPTPLA